MDNFNLQAFVKKSKDEYYTNLYEGKEKHSMEEKMHDDDHKMEEKMHHKDHKMEENHQNLHPEVAERIEGLLNIPMKAKFLSAGVDLINDYLEDEPMDVEDVVSHLANELTKEYHIAGEHGTAVAIDEDEEDPNEMDETLNESVDLKSLMNGDKVNNDALVVMATSYKDEDDARKKAMRPKSIKDNSKNAGPGAKLMVFANLAGGPDREMKIEDGKVVDIRLFSDWDNMNEEVVKEVSLNASELETAMAALGGILGLPAVAFLSAKAQEKLKAMKDKKAVSAGLTEEEEIEIEDETPAMDLDLDISADEPDNKEVFSQLVDAYESAKELGDEKLTRQLANTITYFNKTIIFGDKD